MRLLACVKVEEGEDQREEEEDVVRGASQQSSRGLIGWALGWRVPQHNMNNARRVQEITDEPSKCSLCGFLFDINSPIQQLLNTPFQRLAPP